MSSSVFPESHGFDDAQGFLKYVAEVEDVG